MFRNCETRLGEDESIADFYAVPCLMSSYRKRGQLYAVWKAMESTPCARSLTRRERNWFVLSKAVGRRDPAALESTAKTQLSQESNIPPGPMRYPVSSAMPGGAGTGRSGRISSAVERVPK